MLHRVTLATGAVCLAAGVIVLAIHRLAPAMVFLFWGIILVVGIVFERFRYKPLLPERPPSNYLKTSERFIDDETGKLVTVYSDPATGERIYVQE